MPYAVTLRLDAAAATAVEAMWRTLAARGVSDDSLRLGYPAHVTLAVLPDAADEGRLLGAARDLATGWNGLPVRLASLGLFPGDPAGLFLAPAASAALTACHEALLTSLSGEAIDPHYQRGNFVPHVTLAQDVKDVGAAVAALWPMGLPIVGVLDAVEVVRFRPVRILASHKLAE